MKKKVTFFISYAHKNKALANGFIDRLMDELAVSKLYDYSLWQDVSIEIGEDFEKQILSARDTCDFGLLLLSTAFLASRFITEKELPIFTSDEKPSIPVMLSSVDFLRHDLRGLEKRKIFMLDYEGFKEPRAYVECKPPRRATFVRMLFRAIEDKLSINIK